MKANQLIEIMNTLINQHGNLDVTLASIDSEKGEFEELDLQGITLSLGKDNKPERFLLSDTDTIDMFVEFNE